MKTSAEMSDKNSDSKIIEDVDNWTKEQLEYKKYKFNNILNLFGVTFVLVFVSSIIFTLSNCIIVSCDNSAKNALEKQKVDFEQEKIKKENFSPELRNQILEDCKKLKEMMENEKTTSHSLKTEYWRKYKQSCVNVLVNE